MTRLSPVVAIILAAGASTRLGRPKQLVSWGAEKLLERAVRVAREAGCQPIVVLGSCAEQIASNCDLGLSEVVVNQSWQQGMATSVRAGIQAAAAMGAEAALLMTCDQPAVTAEHLRRLVDAGSTETMVASAYAGRRGVPAYFDASLFPLLGGLRGDSGARNVLRDASAFHLPFGELDVDTDDALRRAKEVLLGSKA